MVIDVNGSYAFVNGAGSSDEVWYNTDDDDWYTGTSNSQYSAHPIVGTSGATSATDQAAAIFGVIDGTSQSLDQIVPVVRQKIAGLGPHMLVTRIAAQYRGVTAAEF